MSSKLDPIAHLIPPLEEDVRMLALQIEENPSDTAKRSFVRAVFSAIEATVYAMKDLALQQHGKGHCQFTAAQVALLREESYFLDDRGIARSRPNYPTLPPNIRFAFEAFGRVCNSPYRINADHGDWKRLSRAIALRNRITHPRHPSELRFTDDELDEVRLTFEWFIQNWRYALADALAGVFNNLQELKGLPERILFGHERKARADEKGLEFGRDQLQQGRS